MYASPAASVRQNVRESNAYWFKDDKQSTFTASLDTASAARAAFNGSVSAMTVALRVDRSRETMRLLVPRRERHIMIRVREGRDLLMKYAEGIPRGY